MMGELAQLEAWIGNLEKERERERAEIRKWKWDNEVALSRDLSRETREGDKVGIRKSEHKY